MNELYYTPNIEEFHIGFKYEEDIREIGSDGDYDIDWGENWIDNEFTSGEDLDDIRELIELDRVRVKLLDREDIESLGFKQFDIEGQLECYWLNDNDYYNNGHRIILDPYTKNHYFIEHSNNYFNDKSVQLFSGYIKNKSELKKLLVQLGIN